MIAVQNEFEQLQLRLPLPPGWKAPELFEDKFSLGDLSLTMIGIASQGPNGQMVTGSAADSGDSTIVRAYFELLERTAVLTAAESTNEFRVRNLESGAQQWVSNRKLFPESSSPDIWQFAKSNGVAASVDADRAETSACLELLERDAILRSWRGETNPVRLAYVEPSAALKERYDLRAVEFPQEGQTGCRVVGVFALSRDASNPVVYGFGAAPDQIEAVRLARREMLQRLAFLWGEPIDEAPPCAPNPLYHQELYLHPDRVERLSAWLSGRHCKAFGVSTSQPRKRCVLAVADITPAHLEGKVTIVKALSADCLPLTFGHAPIEYLPEELWDHPIA